jgi:hypothetical protein
VVEGTLWQLWDCRSGDGDWLNVKLLAPARERRRKHAYWLGWSRKQQRFARGFHYHGFADPHLTPPTLFHWVAAVLRRVAPPPVSPHEI